MAGRIDAGRAIADAPDPFTSQIGAMLAKAEEERARRVQEMQAVMWTREAVEARFAPAADRLHQDVIGPRLDAIARQFPGARLEQFRTPAGVQSRCIFQRSERFPASVTLTLGVMLDAERGIASLFQSIEFVPILFEIERAAHLDMSLDDMDQSRAANWVQEQLLEFLRQYLRLETDVNYQRSNEGTDPVCGMRVSSAATAHRRQFEHHTYSFCSAACEERFAAEPAFYLSGRSKVVAP